MKLLFITTLLIAFNIHAQIELEDCAIAGDHFGSQTSIPSSIPNECHQLLKNAKTTYNFHKSPDQLVSVIGSKNLLLTTLYKEDENKKLLIQKRHITSGENSKLTEILAVKTNQFDQKTYVLNQDKNNFSLYSYFYNSGGNNVPARKLISTEIFNATNFVIDNNAEEIYVI